MRQAPPKEKIEEGRRTITGKSRELESVFKSFQSKAQMLSTKRTFRAITRALLLLIKRTGYSRCLAPPFHVPSLRHHHSLKRPFYNTCVITFFVIVHNTTIYPQSVCFTPKY